MFSEICENLNSIFNNVYSSTGNQSVALVACITSFTIAVLFLVMIFLLFTREFDSAKLAGKTLLVIFSLFMIMVVVFTYWL